jgi:hypothetical protein
MPRLLVNPGTPHQWEINLKPGTNTLGRSSSCDAQVNHGSVSSTHCEVTVNGDAIVVRDLGSTNGTFLNRAPIEQATLTSGQRLQLGGVEMELAPDSAAPRVAPSAIRVARSEPEAAPANSAPAPPMAPARITGLRISHHEPAAAPPPPPVAVTVVADEYAEQQPTGPAMCKYHPASLARYLCPECQLHYCELCVTSRPDGTRTGKFCRRCSNELVGLQVQLIRPGADKENYFANIPKAFVYPFKGSGALFLVIGAIFWVLVDFLGMFAWYLRVMYVSYTFAYVQRVIHTAAQGSDEGAGWPDVSEFWDDIVIPFFQTLTLGIVCFGPAVGVASWLGWDLVSSRRIETEYVILLGAAVAFGAIYYPMAFLAMAMFDSVTAINPLVVIPAMVRVPLEYLTVLFVTALIFVLVWVNNILMEVLSLGFLSLAFTTFVELYFLTVKGRLLGLMYFAKREKIGWFN